MMALHKVKGMEDLPGRIVHLFYPGWIVWVFSRFDVIMHIPYMLDNKVHLNFLQVIN